MNMYMEKTECWSYIYRLLAHDVYDALVTYKDRVLVNMKIKYMHFVVSLCSSCFNRLTITHDYLRKQQQ
jgi:hypothetical protein